VSGSDVSTWIPNLIALVVTVVWATSFIADIAIPEYSPPVYIHVAFMAVVGSIFGFQVVSRRSSE
jgi:hypothetical protein